MLTQLCPTLRNPVNCNPPGSSVHGIFPGKNDGGTKALTQVEDGVMMLTLMTSINYSLDSVIDLWHNAKLNFLQLKPLHEYAHACACAQSYPPVCDPVD